MRHNFDLSYLCVPPHATFDNNSRHGAKWTSTASKEDQPSKKTRGSTDFINFVGLFVQTLQSRKQHGGRAYYSQHSLGGSMYAYTNCTTKLRVSNRRLNLRIYFGRHTAAICLQSGETCLQVLKIAKIYKKVTNRGTFKKFRTKSTLKRNVPIYIWSADRFVEREGIGHQSCCGSNNGVQVEITTEVVVALCWWKSV